MCVVQRHHVRYTTTRCSMEPQNAEPSNLFSASVWVSTDIEMNRHRHIGYLGDGQTDSCRDSVQSGLGLILTLCVQMDGTGRLNLQEFRHLWNKIKQWQVGACICWFNFHLRPSIYSWTLICPHSSSREYLSTTMLTSQEPSIVMRWETLSTMQVMWKIFSATPWWSQMELC